MFINKNLKTQNKASQRQWTNKTKTLALQIFIHCCSERREDLDIILSRLLYVKG